MIALQQQQQKFEKIKKIFIKTVLQFVNLIGRWLGCCNFCYIFETYRKPRLTDDSRQALLTINCYNLIVARLMILIAAQLRHTQKIVKIEAQETCDAINIQQ